jgi:hypothetical protein
MSASSKVSCNECNLPTFPKSFACRVNTCYVNICGRPTCIEAQQQAIHNIREMEGAIKPKCKLCKMRTTFPQGDTTGICGRATCKEKRLESAGLLERSTRDTSSYQVGITIHGAVVALPPSSALSSIPDKVCGHCFSNGNIEFAREVGPDTYQCSVHPGIMHISKESHMVYVPDYTELLYQVL